ncbi:hypothetical protein QBC47DRAFT_404531 [Echria macrotheca]|uniref:Uncharacterized protein n=1 Tax=Echria macrotheca TaxID=438768 RepID=A0AAJ0BC60_9PEZI|nr:hypothetical protein QBC47DRAFT_404531 [Echria macrotheca]
MFQGRRSNRSEPAPQQPYSQRPPPRPISAANTTPPPSRYETAPVPAPMPRDGGSSSSSSTTPTSSFSEQTLPSSPAESLPSSPPPRPQRVRARDRITAARNTNSPGLLRPPPGENDGQPVAQGELNLLDKELLRNRELVEAIQRDRNRDQDKQAQTLAEAQAQVDKLREERRSLEDQLAKQKQVNEKADRDRKAVDAQLAAAITDKKNLESQLKNALANADGEKKQLQTKLEAADKEKKQLEARVREVEADGTQLRARLGVVERDLQKERGGAASLQETIRMLTQERDELQLDSDWLEDQIKERDAQIKENEKMLQEWKQRHDIMKAGMGAPGKMLAEMAKQLMENNRLLEAMTSAYKTNGGRR